MRGYSLLWPDSCGFRLHGAGPCYVTAVTRGAAADAAGLAPGDQLLELDGHDVADMSAEAVRRLALHSTNSPPTVGGLENGVWWIRIRGLSG